MRNKIVVLLVLSVFFTGCFNPFLQEDDKEEDSIYGIKLSAGNDLNLGVVIIGYPEQDAHNVTITNTGNRPTGELNISLSGENADSFALSSEIINSISVNNSAVFTIVPDTGLDVSEYNAAVKVSGDNNINAVFNVSFNVTKKSLTISGIEAKDRVYNGTRIVELTGGVLEGVEDGDIVSFTLGEGLMDNADAGENKFVSAAIALIGDDAGIYSFTQPDDVKVTIAPMEITVTPYPLSKLLNAQEHALTFLTEPELAEGDVFTGALSRAQGETAGDYIISQGTLSAGNNYKITFITGVLFTIKLFDGTFPVHDEINEVYFEDMKLTDIKLYNDYAWITPAAPIFAGDAQVFSAVYSDPSGTFLPVTGNVTVNVAKANPVVTWPENLSCVYGQPLSDITLSGHGAGEPSGDFEWSEPSDSVGAAGTRPHIMSFTPNDTANYNTISNSVFIIVNRKDVTITGVTAGNKVYDGDTAAAINASSAVINGNIDGSSLTISTSAASAVFGSKDAGSRTVTFNGFTFSGPAAGNYLLLEQPASVTANITAKPITLNISNPGRTVFTPLSGESSSTVTVSATGIVSGDSVTYTTTGFTISGSTLTYNGTTAFANPSASLTFTISSGNYSISSGSRTLNVTVYDGQANYTGGAGVYDRRISVTSSNITAFINYANTANGRTRHYKLTQSVTLTAPASGGSNWTAIGSAQNQFTGSFDGQKFTISNLVINNSSTSNLGMFGYTGSGSLIQNIGLLNGSVSGSNNVGGIVGYNNGGTVQNCFNTGSISGAESSGGVVGYNAGTVQYCYAVGAVNGTANNGGLVGANNNIIMHCYATGAVTGTGNNAGGIIGINNSAGTLQSCYSTSSVRSSANVGGIAGTNNGSITATAVINVSITATANNSAVVGCLAGTGSGTYSRNFRRATGIVIRYNTNTSYTINNNDNKNASSMANEAFLSAATWSGAVSFSDTIWNLRDNYMPTLLNMPARTQNPSFN